MKPDIILFILMGVVIFMFVIRPQMRAKKEAQKMLASLKKGDQVVTNSGIHAKINKVSGDNTVEVEIAKNVVVTVSKEAIVKKI